MEKFVAFFFCLCSDLAIKREHDSNQARNTSSGAKIDSAIRENLDRNESSVDVPRANETSRGSLYSDKVRKLSEEGGKGQGSDISTIMFFTETFPIQNETKKRWFHLDYEESHKRRIGGNRRQHAEVSTSTSPNMLSPPPPPPPF